MARQRGRYTRTADESSDEEEWLITYSDAVTLLLAFFVILYSMSEIKVERFHEVRAGIVQAFGGKTKAAPDNDSGKGEKVADAKFTTLKKALANYVNDGTLKVYNTDRGIMLQFNSNAMYPGGTARIRDAFVPVLKKVADYLLTMDPDTYEVEIEGHTDDTPIRTARFPSNWELSTNRATNIVRFLSSHGVPARRLKAAGYADTRPVSPNRTLSGRPIPKNRSANRRVLLKIETN